MARDKVSTDILWKDRKRILFLGLPWSFTRYSVSKDRFFISKGFFSVKDDEVRLYGYFIGALIHAETCRSRNY